MWKTFTLPKSIANLLKWKGMVSWMKGMCICGLSKKDTELVKQGTMEPTQVNYDNGAV
jgi:hypothetical protein